MMDNEKHICNVRTSYWPKLFCHNKAKYFEDGKWYCGTHAPSKIAEREAKRESSEYIKSQLEKAERKLLWAQMDVDKLKQKLEEVE